MKRTRGQTMIVFALCIVALLAVVALGLDGANTFYQRRIAQKAADSASLGATQILAQRGANGSAALENRVLQTVNRLAVSNGGDLEGVAETAPATSIKGYFLNSDGDIVGSQIGLNGGVPATATGVRAIVVSDAPSIMARIIGFEEVAAAAQADTLVFQTEQAQFSPGSGLIPIGIPDDIVNTTAPYDLWAPQNGYTGDSQFKGLLNYDDVSGSGYIDDPADDSLNKPGQANYWAKYGYQGRIAKNNKVALVNGDLGNNCASGLRFFIDNHPQYDNPANPTEATKFAIVYVPIYEYPFAASQPEGTIRVVGFAAFKIYKGAVQSSSASGTWVSFVNLEGEPLGDNANPSNYRGPVTIRMGEN